MKWYRLRLIYKAERGFTLVELLLVIAIAGVIGAGIAMSVSQTYMGNAWSSAHMKAVKEVETAVHWIIPDAEMAQKEFVDPLDDSTTIIGADELDNINDSDGLKLAWGDPWTKTKDEVVYLIQDGQLIRTNTHTDKDGNDNITTSIVARDVDSTNTESELVYLNNNWVLNFKVTTSVGGLRPATETRTFQVILRSEPR